MKLLVLIFSLISVQAFSVQKLKMVDSSKWPKIDPVERMIKERNKVFVTGANSGIGKSLCKRLILKHACQVYLGSRNVEKGIEAIKAIEQEEPKTIGKLELVKIDVTKKHSIVKAMKQIKESLEDEKLYGLVNNAGTGLAHDVDKNTIMKTNLYGTKLTTEAFLPLMNKKLGRIVNLGADQGPLFVGKLNKLEQQLFTNRDVTWGELEKFITARLPKLDKQDAYALSKAAITSYTMMLAREHPEIKSCTVSPGFINTALTKDMGAKVKPDHAYHAIFQGLFKWMKGNGDFFGYDSKKWPLSEVVDEDEEEIEIEDPYKPIDTFPKDRPIRRSMRRHPSTYTYGKGNGDI